MSTAAAIQAQLAAEQQNYQSQLTDLAAQDQRTNAKFGTNAAGQLDFINPADPFSVTGSIKRLFREQNDVQRYSAAGGGGFYDGATTEEAAKLGIRQAQQQRDVTDQYNEAKGATASARVGVEGAFRSASGSLNAQIAQAFADDQAATLAAAQRAGAGAGEAGGARPAAPAGETKKARGFLWRLNSDGKTWTKVRALNAFGQ